LPEEPRSPEVLARARRLVEDLNMTTLGWQMPSDRIMEDFAAGEHGLAAREHRLADVDPGGGPGGSRRAFSLYASGAEATGGEPFALLIEPDGPGTWRLLVTDVARGGHGRA